MSTHATYSYSASKAGKKWYGVVSSAGLTVANIEARTENGLKAKAQAAAENHKRDNTPGDTHGTSKSAFGTINL